MSFAKVVRGGEPYILIEEAFVKEKNSTGFFIFVLWLVKKEESKEEVLSS